MSKQIVSPYPFSHPYNNSHKPSPPYKQWIGPYAEYKMPNALHDRGSPEAEFMKRRSIPFALRSPKGRNDLYYKTVRYHDYPEGVDLVGKLVAVNYLIHPGCLANGALGFMQSQEKTLAAAFIKGYQYTWPGFAVASAFVATTFFSCSFRGKDDYLNYQLGGIGAGTILGGVHRSPLVGVTSSILFMIAATTHFYVYEQGWRWWNFEENLMGGHAWHRFGWELFEDTEEKGYTTSTDK